MTAYHHLIAAMLRHVGAHAPESPRGVPLYRAWQRWRQRPRLDAMNTYLSRASSHGDLEQRIRAWDDATRLDHMPLR